MEIHNFTAAIQDILSKYFGKDSEDVFEKNLLLQYINQKTKSANKGSKSRASFANLYALYVIIEDYIAHDFDTSGKYSKYSGAQYSDLFRRQRELPFGEKLQNHALNNRMNAEFQKFFPTSEIVPIIRNLTTNRYWINENLLKIKLGRKTYNIAKAVIEIINKYIEVKQDSFRRFIEQCQRLQSLSPTESEQVHSFISDLLAPNSDARLFEIVSYSILKFYYKGQHIIWGYDMEHLSQENLHLYKTGRTNANDGGVDFVMRPLGRFFQVTETLDFKKYFLDIEKIERYPVTFVVKAVTEEENILSQLRDNAMKTYVVESIVEKYMDCIEEIINIPKLTQCLYEVEERGLLGNVLNEIIMQSKVEFNFEEE